MTHLTSQQFAIARTHLVRRAEALRREIGAALHQGNGDGPSFQNRYLEADSAVADVETDLEIAGLSRDAQELSDVAAALVRLDLGGYGECIACGKPISWERLAAQPQAARCARCEAVREASSGERR
jgi:DnaK suppressor protein